MKRFFILSVIIFFCIIGNLNAQLTVTGSLTAQQLANILAGSNIVVSNATLTGSNQASGSFNGINTNIGLSSGVILTTGTINDALGPNNQTNSTTQLGTPGTAQMTALAGVNTFDAITLQFDFTVQSDMIQFTYVFASEEYPEYAPPNSSAYNDVFAFFISGPGITGEENIALIPGTSSAVAINNINAITNTQYYVDNTGGATHEFDAFTTPMVARKDGLIPCQTYTLKLVIADAGDRQYNSAVFLQENSLVQGIVNVMPHTIQADDIALEGCVDASFDFTLSQPLTQDYEINFQIAGTATNGIDYDHIDNTIMIPAGQTSATVIIDPILDGIPEGQETILLIYRPEVCAAYDTVMLFIDDAEPIVFSLTGTNLDCYQDTSGEILISATGGFPAYTYHVTNEAGVTSLFSNNPVTGLAAGTYAVQVYDTYGCKAEALVIGGVFDADTTFLPDGSGVSYTSTINIAGFPVGETIDDMAELQAICANMEHSYLGDLQIKVIAPSGQSVILKEFYGGGSCDLGEPVATGPIDGWEGSLITTPGTGFDYCFNANPDNGTMVSESNNYTHTYIDNDGHNLTDYYLPAGSYVSYQPLSNLLGAVKNGVWTLEVTDQFSLDNGYIFYWTISMTSDMPDTLVVLNEPLGMDIGGFVTQATCGGSNGAINITVNGNSPPFTYLWSNSATTEDITGIPSGTYHVTVTDDNSCSHVSTYVLTNVSSLNVTKTVHQIDCNGSNDGSVNITTSGGTPPYTFLWSNGATTEDISGLAAGTYTLSITDNSNCIFIDNTILVQNPQISISLVGSSNEICGDANGSININVTGGSGSYAYLWSNSATTQDLNNVSASTYLVTVTDGFGCTKSASYLLINNVSNCSSYCYLDISNVAVTNDMCGSGTGAVNITLSDVTLPCTILWSNGATTEDISGLAFGNYSVTINDAANCQTTETITVGNNTGTLTISNSLITDEMCGNGDGVINITVSGGSLPYSFLWSNSSTTEDISNASAGNYSVEIHDGNNCLYSESFIVNNNTGTLASTAVVTNEICSNHLGAINQTVSGGNGTITYHWSTNATTQDIGNLVAGNYQCTITDNAGCELIKSYTLTNVQGNLSISDVIVTNETCNNNQGSINISVTGGSGGYFYSWSNSAITEDISNLNEGVYSCTVTDGNGCNVPTGTLYVFNTGGTLVVQDIYITDEICNNHEGAANISVSGGTGPYTYLWSTGSTSQDLIAVPAGAYVLTVTDANNCQTQHSVTIDNSQGNLQHLNSTITDETCGNGLGQINNNYSGGVTPITYLWNTGAITKNLNGLHAGTYSCTVTDNAGCSLTISWVVDNNTTGLAASFIPTNEVCSNGQGTIDITVTGGFSPISYLWSNTATTQDISGLSANTYSCTITDNSGCKVYTGNIAIGNNPGTLEVSATSVNEICDNNLGSIDLTVSGGTSPYTYNWSNSATTQDISGLSSGNYLYTVSDAGGCKVLNSKVITNTPGTLAVVSTVVTNEHCNNNLGAINLTVSGGTGTVHYLWSNAAITEDIASLNEGVYACTITDDNNCQTIVTGIIVANESGTLAFTNIHTHNETCNNNQGLIDITFTGGTGPFIYNWSNGLHTQDISGLNEGNYTVTVIDAANCSIEITTTIYNSPGTLNVSSFTITNEACDNAAGAINITVQGGTIPYTYLWSNGPTTQDLSNLIAGNYSCQISDNSGCITSFDATVNEVGNDLTISAAETENEMCGNGTGSINITVTGGVLPYLYSWDNGSVSQDLSGLHEGNYAVTITDVNDCETMAAYTIINNTMSLAIDTIIVANENCGNSNGQIDLIYSGGNEPVTVLWNTGAIGESLESIGAGSYTVSVTDHYGCQVTGSGTVQNISGGFAISGNTVVDENCGDDGGSIDLTVSGGATPYVYLWNNSATSEDISGLHEGNYSCTITDNNNCHIVFMDSILNITTGVAIINAVTNNDYCSTGVAFIDLVVQGGSLPYTYLWSSGQTTEDLSGINGGSYICTVTDALGCKVVSETYIIQNLMPDIVVSPSTTGDLCGLSTGTISTSVTGGYTPYSYLWDNGAITANQNGLDAGLYAGTITDATGCATTLIVQVMPTTDPNAHFSSITVTNDNCGQGQGEIVFQHPGADIYQFELNGAAGGTPVHEFVNLLPGNYELSIIRGTCRQDSMLLIDNSTPFDVTIASSINELCGNSEGWITLDVTPIGTYTYQWSNNTFDQTAYNLAAGTYTCEITDGTGCHDFISSSITNETYYSVTSSVSDEICGSSNGSISLTVTGTSGNETFLWNNGDTTAYISGLAAGNYSCTVDDGSGCLVMANEIVGNNTGGFTVDPVITSDFCSGSQGMITLIITNGSGSYSYLWNTGAVTDTLNNIVAGTYAVTVTDLISVCSFSDNNIVVGNSGFFTVSEIINHATCSSCNDGMIDLTLTGVGSDYDFIWSNGATTEDLNVILPGTYTVTITDSWGCILIETFTVGFTTELPAIAGNNDMVVVFPNPSEGIFNVKYQLFGSTPVRFEVYDATGRLVKIPYAEMNHGEIIFNLHAYPPGVYVLRVIGGSAIYNMKLVLR